MGCGTVRKLGTVSLTGCILLCNVQLASAAGSPARSTFPRAASLQGNTVGNTETLAAGRAQHSATAPPSPPPAPRQVRACTPGSPTVDLPFCNPDLPRDSRAWDLIKRLNLSEKVSLLSADAVWVPRLGVHSLSGGECLHGLFNRFHNVDVNGTVVPYLIDGAATVFPQAIGLAATWNRSLLRAMGDVISTEAVAMRNGHLQQWNSSSTRWPDGYYTCWAPVINIARDTRWGRVPETYGEDPLLTRELAINVVQGLQGTDPEYLKVSASPKHFTVYDGPESAVPGATKGRMGFNAVVPPEDLDQTWLDHWRGVVTNSGTHPLGGVMCSYSALDYVPMCGNREMLTDTLRTEWGFTGWVVSDCGAVSNIATMHKYVNTTQRAATLALTAGCDMECGSAFSTLPDAVSQGTLDEAAVDTALYRPLIQQFNLGVFDPPELNPYSAIPPTQVDTDDHRQLARDAAAQSAVLLANVGNLLPLNLRKLTRVAVIGPNANNTAGYDRCWEAGGGGCLYAHTYRGYPSFVSTPLMGIQAAVAEAQGNTTVTYAEGCGSRFPKGLCSDPSGIPTAVAVAQAAEVAIIVVGLDESYEEEGTDRLDPSTSGGGNGLFQLPGHQQQLVDAVVATGVPVVQVLINGGPLSLSAPASAAKFALLEAWYGGQACGDGIADVLFGSVPPSGKMPVTAYANPTQAGDITDMNMTAGLGRTYRYLTTEPTYPFGFGLSYTTWAWRNFTLNVSADGTNENTPVSATVQLSNTGDVDSAQVVQLYASLSQDFSASRRRPLIAGAPSISPHVPSRQLADFTKVHVGAGETIKVNFTVIPAELAGWMLWHAPNATVYVAVGGVSPTAQTLASGQLLRASFTVLRP